MYGFFRHGEKYQGTEAGYLAKEIAHRLPAKKQIIPTPKPGERVVFIPYFLRGLGFSLHPFVRGLMFYYGLDFHDLASNSFLNISAFIVICEAFLRIPPTSACGSRFQCKAESGERPARGLRQRYGEQTAQRHLAPGHLRGDREEMAAGVVLCHRAS